VDRGPDGEGGEEKKRKETNQTNSEDSANRHPKEDHSSIGCTSLQLQYRQERQKEEGKGGGKKGAKDGLHLPLHYTGGNLAEYSSFSRLNYLLPSEKKKRKGGDQPQAFRVLDLQEVPPFAFSLSLRHRGRRGEKKRGKKSIMAKSARKQGAMRFLNLPFCCWGGERERGRKTKYGSSLSHEWWPSVLFLSCSDGGDAGKKKEEVGKRCIVLNSLRPARSFRCLFY